VFTASSKEDLNEMLRCENDHLESGSVTAAQFAYERLLQAHERVQHVSDCGERGQNVRQAIVATCSPLYENKGASVRSSGLNWLDKKRLELEYGGGGDHESLYTFALPPSIPQILSWTKLLVKVQRGEL